MRGVLYNCTVYSGERGGIFVYMYRGAAWLYKWRAVPCLPCVISVMTVGFVHLLYSITAAGNSISSQLSSSYQSASTVCQGRWYGSSITVKKHTCRATLHKLS